MIARAATTPQSCHSRPKQFHTIANLANRRECATLIVDDLGIIRGCGAAAEDIFGACQSRLRGRKVSGFVADLAREGSSPGDNARFLAHLSTDSAWRRFEATDAGGRGFAVEINVSRRMADGHELFVLNLRRPGEPA